MGQADAVEEIPDARSARVLASGSTATEHTHRTSTRMPSHPNMRKDGGSVTQGMVQRAAPPAREGDVGTQDP